MSKFYFKIEAKKHLIYCPICQRKEWKTTEYDHLECTTCGYVAVFNRIVFSDNGE